jgi:hypothetical protein
VSRYAFYDHMKVCCAAPPEVLRIDEKFIREYYILNCCGVLVTSNHKIDGIFLPADDRRHYVAWSDSCKEDFEKDYWRKLWASYDAGGDRAVLAYLKQLDLSSFDPKAPPPKTAAFWEIVDANRAPEDAAVADAIDLLGRPDAITLAMIKMKAEHVSIDFLSWLGERKSHRAIPHRLESCGYVAVRNDGAADGLWKFRIGGRQVIYAKAELSPRDRIAAAQRLVRNPNMSTPKPSSYGEIVAKDSPRKY